MRRTLTVGGRVIGGGAPCFVIAEAGVNHNGDVRLAEQLVDAAAAAGADCVKFQTFHPAKLASSLADKASYQKETTGGGSQREMLERLVLPDDAWPRLMERARERHIGLLSTPFDEDSLDLLVRMGVPALKLGSGELTNHFLLQHAKRSGLPLLLSTGMATLDEVASAVAVVGDVPFALFHCVSSYPANPADANLRAMSTMRSAFQCPVGFSDHTLGNEVALAAVALGAELVEKHLTLDKTMDGPDHRASAEPHEMKQLVEGVRNVERALGDGNKAPRPAEVDVRRAARRSLFWSRDVEAGTTVERAHLSALRPETGISAARAHDIIGRTLKRDVRGGELVEADDVRPS